MSTRRERLRLRLSGTQRAQRETGQYTLKNNHRQTIENALEDRLPVPPEVLKDYPDLVKATPKVEIPKEGKIIPKPTRNRYYIERILNLVYEPPDLEEIAKKLQEEATDKKKYAPQGSISFFPEFIMEGWIRTANRLNHFINCILRSKQRKSQNQTTDEGKNKTNDI